MNTENILRNLRAKLQRQEQACQETRDHIEILEERIKDLKNKDQHPLPLDAGKKK